MCIEVFFVIQILYFSAFCKWISRQRRRLAIFNLFLMCVNIFFLRSTRSAWRNDSPFLRSSAPVSFFASQLKSEWRLCRKHFLMLLAKQHRFESASSLCFLPRFIDTKCFICKNRKCHDLFNSFLKSLSGAFSDRDFQGFWLYCEIRGVGKPTDFFRRSCPCWV